MIKSLISLALFSLLITACGGSESESSPVTNHAPTLDEASFSIEEDLKLQGIIIGNDHDGDNLTYNLISNVSNGVLVFSSDGSFEYDPSVGFNGEDSFTASVSDGELSSSSVAFTIQVNAVHGGREVSISTNKDVGIVGTPYILTWTIGNSNSCSLTGAITDTVISDGTVTITPEAYGAHDTVINCESESARVTVNVISELVDIPDEAFADALSRLGYKITNGSMAAEDALSIEMLCITSMVGFYGEPDSNNTAIFDNTSVPDSGVRCSYTNDYITDTTGLESFLNLKTMRLEMQQFTTVDLSSLKEMFFLSLWGNPLTTLDVSENVEITSLGLSETSLRSIDTSKLSKLMEAAFQQAGTASELPVTLGNGTTVYGFTTVDFASNKQLKRVYLNGNPLTNLGISQNSSSLYELWATGTFVESLDLSSFEYLNYVILSDSLNLSYLNLDGVNRNSVPYRLYLEECQNLDEVIVHNVGEYLTAIQNQKIWVDSHITFIELTE